MQQDQQSFDPSQDSGEGGMTSADATSTTANAGPNASYDPSRAPDSGGGMTSADAASTLGDPGPNASYDPSRAPDSGGGMTSADAASTLGDPGPNASQGPTATERAYAQGQHDQYVADHEALQHEDPIGGAITAAAGGIEGALHSIADFVKDLGNEKVDEGTYGSDHGSAPPPDIDDQQPDATVSGDAGGDVDTGGYDPSYGSH